MSESDNHTDHGHPTGDDSLESEGTGSASPPDKPEVTSASAKEAASAQAEPARPAGVELDKMDPGSEALTEALRISFGVLKIVMLAVVGMFIWSGAYTVGANEQAIELRFGKIKGVGAEAIIETGLHWKWPAPIEEVIKLPLSIKELGINAFWHNQPEDSQLNLPTLRFGVDGYGVTASSAVADIISAPTEVLEALSAATSTGVTDYNLVHTNWQLKYRIDTNDSEGPIKLVERLWDGTAGERGAGTGWFQVNTFLNKVVNDAVVSVSAQWDIEQILWDNSTGYRAEVEERIRERLAAFDVGLVVDSMNLVNREPPRQLKEAFAYGSEARSEKPRMENEAEGMANLVLSQAQSDADILLSEARAYKNTQVSEALADALYLEEVLGTITETAKNLVGEDQENYLQKRMAKEDDILVLVLKEMRHQMLREVLQQVSEAIVVPGADEFRFHLNRDAEIQSLPEEEERLNTSVQLYHDPTKQIRIMPDKK